MRNCDSVFEVREPVRVRRGRGRQAIRAHEAQHVGKHVRIAIYEYLAVARRVGAVFGDPRAFLAARQPLAKQRLEVARAACFQRQRGGLKNAATRVQGDAAVIHRYAVKCDQ